jgi:hypothetical protein
MKKNLKHQMSDAELQAAILEWTGTKCLIWLQEWCEVNNLSRSKWADLYDDVVSLRIGSNHTIQQESISCVQQEIKRIEQESQSICDSMGWIILPSYGIGSHEIFDGNILLENIFQCGNGFTVFGLKQKGVYSDVYSAALELLPEDVLERSINVRNLELALAL